MLKKESNNKIESKNKLQSSNTYQFKKSDNAEENLEDEDQSPSVLMTQLDDKYQET